MMNSAIIFPMALAALSTVAGAASADGCATRSASTLTPVLELYTSEGCSSCPPADRWLSTLNTPAVQGRAVVQAFHVGYWDYIGWVDRFATPAHTSRQRQIAASNSLSSVYTPQLVRNGRDWRNWGGAPSGFDSAEPARALIEIERAATGPEGDRFEARVTPAGGDAVSWSAYWSITENGHGSKVRAGENAGETLRHDFVVRQYVPVGSYRGSASLSFRTIAAEPAHPRRVNLVVFEPRTGRPLQAISLSCETG